MIFKKSENKIELLKEENKKLKEINVTLEESIKVERELHQQAFKKCQELIVELEDKNRKVSESYAEMTELKKQYAENIDKTKKLKLKLELLYKSEEKKLKGKYRGNLDG